MKRKAGPLLFSTLGLFLGLLLFRSVTCAADAAPEPSAAGNRPCRLVIEGKLIQHMVLDSRDGHHYAFDRPSDAVRLLPGEYRLQRIELQGGCTWERRSDAEPWLGLTPGDEQRMVAGAPLRPSVAAIPRGGYLELAYGLKDSAGRSYQGSPQTSQPRFTISKDGKEVASGCFQYG